MSKHPPKNTKKHLVFLDVFRGRFLDAFWSKTGPPGGARGPQKSKKKMKKTVLGTFLVSSCASGSILNGF